MEWVLEKSWKNTKKNYKVRILSGVAQKNNLFLF